jgi:hypothetical protein
MTLSRIGGLAALICAATYLVGFALLVTLLAPLGFGTSQIDPSAVVAFIDARPGVMIAWNTTIYVVNALALVVLVVALAHRLSPAPGWVDVTRGFGLIWAALVLGAGMIANVAVERAAALFAEDPVAAADLWVVLHAIELGLGGGNEIAGGIWILCVSIAAGRTRRLPRIVNALGLLTGLGGLATIFPPLGDVAGAVFGLSAIAWFIAVGVALMRQGGTAAAGVGGRAA